MSLVGLDADDIIELNRIVGGLGAGLLDRAGVEAIAGEPFQTFGQRDLYPSIWLKAAVLLRGLITTQYFRDGNKRTAWAAAEAFIELNNQELDDIDDDVAEQFAYEVIAHQHDVEAIAEWLLIHSTPLIEDLGEHGDCRLCGAEDVDLPGAELFDRMTWRAGLNQREGGTFIEQVGPNDAFDLYVGETNYDALVAGVCRRCRRGWMALIERQDTVPAVALLLDSERPPSTVPAAQAKAAARWILKYVLVRALQDQTVPTTLIIESGRLLRQRGRIGGEWSLWVSPLIPQDHFGRNRLVVGAAEGQPMSLQVSMICGSTGVCALYDPREGDRWATDFMQEAVEDGETPIRRLWPHDSSLTWPPSDLALLDEREFLEVVGGLLRRGD